MPKVAYIEKKFRAEALSIIETANRIIQQYRVQGYDLTLRQLYYQFVSRDLIENTEKSYKRLGEIISDGRLAGLIDWTAIVDRTRNLQTRSRWDDPAHIIESAAGSYHVDRWQNQLYRPEVWVEKDALIGVVARICNQYDVPYFACRGYTSQSEMWAAAQRLKAYSEDEAQTPIIFHLGDHDPSGKDMTRDIVDRLDLFMGGLEVKRLALNWDQIQQYNPPPNPAKLTDARAAGYVAEFGTESWELDALEPRVISDLIEREILAIRLTDQWNAIEAQENEERKSLQWASDNWQAVHEHIEQWMGAEDDAA